MKEIGQMIILAIANLISRGSFVAGACYLADRHPVMAAWCIVGAFIIGYTKSENKK